MMGLPAAVPRLEVAILVDAREAVPGTRPWPHVAQEDGESVSLRADVVALQSSGTSADSSDLYGFDETHFGRVVSMVA